MRRRRERRVGSAKEPVMVKTQSRSCHTGLRVSRMDVRGEDAI